MFRCYRLAGIAGSWLGLLFLATPVQAEPETRQDLREAVKELAKGVKAVVEKAEQTAVRIGRFTPTGLDDSNAGDGLSALLAESLGTFVNAGAVLEVKGDFGFVKDEKVAGVKVIKVRAKVVNTQTLEELKAFLPLDAVIGANGDIARLLNLTGSLDRNGNFEDRNKEIQRQQKEKSVFIDPAQPTLISSSAQSDYAVELRVKPLKDHDKHPAQPRKAEVKNGQAFVAIDKGELYEVRLLNKSRHESAIILSIDGIDLFAFSDDRVNGKPRFTHFILPPAKDGKPGELLIPGWHKTADPQRKDNFLSFLVTDNGKGAAAKFPQQAQGKVGVITVSFALAFPEGVRSGGETGFGPPVEVKQKVVKRILDPPHDFVSVRYLR